MPNTESHYDIATGKIQSTLYMVSQNIIPIRPIGYTCPDGREICEFDIIAGNSYTFLKYVVVWDAHRFRYARVLIDSIDLYFDLTLSGYEINLNWLNDYKPKVIGNIFENPEIISPDFDPIDFAKNIGVLKLYFF